MQPCRASLAVLPSHYHGFWCMSTYMLEKIQHHFALDWVMWCRSHLVDGANCHFGMSVPQVTTGDEIVCGMIRRTATKKEFCDIYVVAAWLNCFVRGRWEQYVVGCRLDEVWRDYIYDLVAMMPLSAPPTQSQLHECYQRLITVLRQSASKFVSRLCHRSQCYMLL